MNKFQVNLAEHATGDLKYILKEPRDKIHQDLKALEFAPLPSRIAIKSLRGFKPPGYRLRSGDFRVLELEGLGAHIWGGMDAQGYVNEERKSWD